MHSKLKRRVNRLFGSGAWQKLSQSYKDMLIYAGAHHIWREWRQHTSLDEIMGEANFELEQIKAWKETNTNSDELPITPSGEALIKDLVEVR